MSDKKPNWGKAKSATPQRRIDVEEFETGNGVLREVDKHSIFPDPDQPRKAFTEEGLAELQASIEENGLLQPILVTEVDKGDGIGKYRIIAGERRWRAAMSSERIARLQIVIRSDISDELKILLAQIAENIHRENMTIIETAESYKRVLDAVDGDTDKAIKLLNVSRTRFSTILGLNKSDEKVRELATDGITKDVDALAGLNVLATINADKASETVEKIRNGEISKKGIRKTVAELVKEEKSTKKQNKEPKKLETKAVVELADDAENENVVEPHIEETKTNDNPMKGAFSVEFSGELIGELVDFLKEKENSDDYLLIKKVLLALENAKQTGE